MKYVSINIDKFDRPYHAYFAAVIQVVATVFIEIVNIQNLVTITVILDIIMNFVALGVISEADEEFLLPFLTPR